MADATAATSYEEHAYASLVMFRALLNTSGDLAFLIRASPWSVQYVAARVITLCCGPEFPKMPHGSGSMADCAANVTWELVHSAIHPFYPMPVGVSREAAIAGAAFFSGEPAEGDEEEEWDGRLSVENFAEYMARTKTVAPAEAGDAEISSAFMASVTAVFSENPAPMPVAHPQQRQQHGEHDDEKDADEEFLKTYIWKMAAYVGGVNTIPWAAEWDIRRSTVVRPVWQMGRGTRSSLTGERGKMACLQKAFLAGVILCTVCSDIMLSWSGGRCKFGMDLVFGSGKVASVLGQCLYEGACMVHKLMTTREEGESPSSPSPAAAVAIQFWVATCRLEVERCASLSIGGDRGGGGWGGFWGGGGRGDGGMQTLSSALKEYYSGPTPRDSFPSLSRLFTRRERMEMEDNLGGCRCLADGGVKEHAALVSLAHGACHAAEALRPDAVLAWFVERGAFGVELPEKLLAAPSPAAILTDKSLFRGCKWGHMRPGTEFHRRIVHAARVYRGAESSHRKTGSLRLLPCSHEDFVAHWAIAFAASSEAVVFYPPSSDREDEEGQRQGQGQQRRQTQGQGQTQAQGHGQQRRQTQAQGQGQGQQQRRQTQAKGQGQGQQQRQMQAKGQQRRQTQAQGQMQGQGEWSIFGGASAWLKRLF